jgi:hypothetical protein
MQQRRKIGLGVVHHDIIHILYGFQNKPAFLYAVDGGCLIGALQVRVYMEANR